MAPRKRNEDTAKDAFARRLQSLRVAKGWNQSELARQAALYMPRKRFNRDNISKYEMANVLPLPVQLNALAKALGVEPGVLLPEGSVLANNMERTDQLSFQQEGDKAWIRINQKVDLGVAMAILRLLGGHHEAEQDRKRNDT